MDTAVRISKIPEGFVPCSYACDPQVEDVIFGHELKERMVVLLEKSKFRGDPNRLGTSTPDEEAHICGNARWSQVCYVRRVRGIITIAREYSDGRITYQAYDADTTWIVKKSSTPS